MQKHTSKSSSSFKCSVDTVTCVVPPQFPDSVTVAVSINGGLEFYGSNLKATYVEPYSVLDLMPKQGPISGRTNITVKTSGLKLDVKYVCMFGLTRQEAFLINETAAHCSSPLYSDNEYGSSVDFNLLPGGGISGSRNVAKAHSSIFTITKDLAFFYYPNVVIEAVRPRIMPNAGGTHVSIIGYNF